MNAEGTAVGPACVLSDMEQLAPTVRQVIDVNMVIASL
jgi:hypothetical protein